MLIVETAEGVEATSTHPLLLKSFCAITLTDTACLRFLTPTAPTASTAGPAPSNLAPSAPSPPTPQAQQQPARLSPPPVAPSTSSTPDDELSPHLRQLISLLPTLLQLPALLPTLRSLASRVENATAVALVQHSSTQAALDSTSASLNNLWSEVGNLDSGLADVNTTLGGLQGSVDRLWEELSVVDGEKEGWVRVEQVQNAVDALEKKWEARFEALKHELSSAAPSASSSLRNQTESAVPRQAPTSLGKHPRSTSGASALATEPRSMLPPPLAGPSNLSVLGRAELESAGPARKKQRIVSVAQSEMAVEGLLDENGEDDDILVMSNLSPAGPHPPSTPPPRASPSLAGPDPTFTPSTSSSAAKAAQSASKAAAEHHHQPPALPFPLFATSPRPPKEAPISPTFESPRRVGQASAGGISLTPGRTLFADTPRSRAARGGVPGSASQRRLASDSHHHLVTSSTSTASPPAQSTGRTLNFDQPQGTSSRPVGLSLLPSLPLTLSDEPSQRRPLSPEPNLNASINFPFPIHLTPPPHRSQHRGVPPTPPAPRTMFGTERDRDDRFGDDEA